MAMIKVTVGNNTSRTSVIVNTSSTLREACEQAGFDYFGKNFSLNGTPVRDLDRTFGDYDISDTAFLLSVVKADNAASCHVIGNVIVIQSNIKEEDFELVRKFSPESLIIKDENKNAIFRITTGNSYICDWGVTFNTANQSGEMVATIVDDNIPNEDTEEYVIDKVGKAITHLKTIEASLPSIIQRIKNERAAIKAVITVK